MAPDRPPRRERDRPQRGPTPCAANSSLSPAAPPAPRTGSACTPARWPWQDYVTQAVGRLRAHSLRAGYVTAAAQRGASERAIARVSRHRSVPVLRGYVRAANLWNDAATDIGL